MKKNDMKKGWGFLKRRWKYMSELREENAPKCNRKAYCKPEDRETQYL